MNPTKHPLLRAACAAALLLTAFLAQAQAPVQRASAAAAAAASPASSAARLVQAPASAPARNASAPLALPAFPSSPQDGGGVRALVFAEMEATISSQFAGRLISVPKQVGDSFAAGDVLAAFDCREREARTRTFQAELLGAQETHLAKLKLQSLGAVSDLDVTLAAAAAEKAKAQLAAAQVEEKYCTVLAPYPGKIVRVRAKAFESVQLGQPLMEIVNPASLRAQLFVPSTWIRWIKAGESFRISIEETGQTYTAKISKISGRIDGTSQTVEVMALFDTIPPNLLPGMIGRAIFPKAKGR